MIQFLLIGKNWSIYCGNQHHAVALGFAVRLVTNGTMLYQEDLIRSITASDQVCVRVSMDGHSPKTHAVHHRCQEGQFTHICDQVVAVINRRGRVGISYLLTPESIQELPQACRFWKNNGAETLSPRIMTHPHGLRLMTAWTKTLLDTMMDVIQEYGDWLSFSSGFMEWIVSGTPQDQVRFDRCYTGYFRLVLSPFIDPPDHSPLTAGRDDHVSVTDRIWISACPYYRYDPVTGCEYPQDLVSWWFGQKWGWLDQAWPLLPGCRETLCSRQGLNKAIHQAVLDWKPRKRSDDTIQPTQPDGLTMKGGTDVYI